MNRREHLLVIAMEECNEVSQRLSKALRFGLDETQPEHSMTNRERIIQEYTDLVAVLQLLGLDDWSVNGAVEKQDKIDRFLVYSKTQGTLSE